MNLIEDEQRPYHEGFGTPMDVPKREPTMGERLKMVLCEAGYPGAVVRDGPDLSTVAIINTTTVTVPEEVMYAAFAVISGNLPVLHKPCWTCWSEGSSEDAMACFEGNCPSA